MRIFSPRGAATAGSRADAFWRGSAGARRGRGRCADL